MSQRKASLLAEAEGRGLEAKPTMTIKALEELLAANPPKAETASKQASAADSPDSDEQEVPSDDSLEGPVEEEDKTFAKAGKRSAKAAAAEAEAARQTRRQTSDDEPAKASKPVKPPRSRLERRGQGLSPGPATAGSQQGLRPI